MDATCDFLLVIPAYEEHRRLPPFLRDLVRQLGDATYTTKIQIVDDGSSAASLRELTQALDKIRNSTSVQILPLLSLNARRGKGCAIRTGWNSGVKATRLAFVDADGAIPAREVGRVFGIVSRDSAPAETGVCVAVRQGRRAHRTWLRKLAGRMFARAVNLAFRCSFQDPQCGFKIMSSFPWENVRGRSHENGFCFDLELLLLLKRNKLSLIHI